MIAADLAPSHNSANTKAQNAARKFPRLEIFLKTSNCYPTEGPNSALRRYIYWLDLQLWLLLLLLRMHSLSPVSSQCCTDMTSFLL